MKKQNEKYPATITARFNTNPKETNKKKNSIPKISMFK